MLYLLIFVLATVLALLLRVQKKRRLVWLAAYARPVRVAEAEAEASVPPVEPKEDNPIPFQLIEANAEADEAAETETERARGMVLAGRGVAPVFAADEQFASAPADSPPAYGAIGETISPQEVLRNLHGSRVAAQAPTPQSGAEAGGHGLFIRGGAAGEDLELITLAEATRLQHQETQTPHHAAEIRSGAPYGAALLAGEGAEIIELADIQQYLSRKQQAVQPAAQIERLPDMPLEEIAAGEVWTNLNRQAAPPLKRRRAQTVQSNRVAAADAEAETVQNGLWPPHNPEPPLMPQAEPAADRPPVAFAAPQVVSPFAVSADAFSPPPAAHPQENEAQQADFRTETAEFSAQTDETAAGQGADISDDVWDWNEDGWGTDAHGQTQTEALAADPVVPALVMPAFSPPPKPAFVPPPSKPAILFDEPPPSFRQPESLAGSLPTLDLLLPPEHNPQAVQTAEELLENSITIEEKLAEYRVKVKVLDAYAGPVITRYEIEPDTGVRGSSVINLEKDLARSLGVAAIRVVETIPGKTCMGLELPNPQRQMIRLREIFASPAFSGSPSKLTLALGQDITGEPVVTDLAKAPHLLVAGTTGSGKSVGVNSMILSMLYKAAPDEVRLIMIDPKMLELSIYEGIPHLLAPVVTDMKLAANALTWCVNEMEKRYRLMSHLGVRNLAGYNQKIAEAAGQGRKIANPFSFTPADAEPLEKLPFIVVVVDEFADLMMVAGKQIEQLIARLAQKARAAGIHLILATQRPSVDVITGLIKANIPTRIAFQVSTKIDSRTILDQMGAENLLGQGDMLFLPPGTGYPQRVHGAFVADSEVHAVVEYLKQFGEPDYVDDILNPIQAELGLEGGSTNGGGSERDPLFDKAVDIVTKSRKTSISYLQRQLRTGYNKAATLMEQMETEGIVSAPDHSGKRTILARKQEE